MQKTKRPSDANIRPWKFPRYVLGVYVDLRPRHSTFDIVQWPAASIDDVTPLSDTQFLHLSRHTTVHPAIIHWPAPVLPSAPICFHKTASTVCCAQTKSQPRPASVPPTVESEQERRPAGAKPCGRSAASGPWRLLAADGYGSHFFNKVSSSVMWLLHFPQVETLQNWRLCSTISRSSVICWHSCKLRSMQPRHTSSASAPATASAPQQIGKVDMIENYEDRRTSETRKT